MNIHKKTFSNLGHHIKSVPKLHYYPVLTTKSLLSVWFSFSLSFMVSLLFTISLFPKWKAGCCSSPGWHSDTAIAPAGPMHTEAANYENVALCPQWHHTSLMWHKIRTLGVKERSLVNWKNCSRRTHMHTLSLTHAHTNTHTLRAIHCMKATISSLTHQQCTHIYKAPLLRAAGIHKGV